MADNLPAPESRVESYLAKAAGEDVTIPEKPLSRLEQYLDAIAEGGGGGGGTSNFNQLTNRPKNNGATMTGDTDVNSIRTLTEADYNWNDATSTTENPNCVAMWLLDDGLYYADAQVYVSYEPTALNNKELARGYFLVSSLEEPNPEYPYDMYKNAFVIANNVPTFHDYMHFKDPEYWQQNGQGALADQNIVYATIFQYIGTTNSIPDSSTFGPDGAIKAYLDYDSPSPYPIRLFVCNGGYTDPQTQEWKYSWVEITLAPQMDTRLGGLTLLTISQTDYDNLGTKDPNTLYVITGA